MEDSRLVQRLLKPVGGVSSFAFGGGHRNGGVCESSMQDLNKIFSFDYMGAAEFEFGALPEALNKIWDNREDSITGSVKVHWKTEDWRTREKSSGKDEVYYICYKNHVEEVKRRIDCWAVGKSACPVPLKCGAELDGAFKEDRYKGWIEFDNGFFFFIDKGMWENTIKLFEIGEK